MIKILYLVLTIVAILIVGATGVFLWGDEIYQVIAFQEDSDGLSSFDNEIDGRESEDSSIGGAGSTESSKGISGGDEALIDSGCNIRSVPYALKNFKENVVCLEWDSDGCIRLSVNCSVEIYNLDDDFSGDFKIRYALLDDSQNELEVKSLSDRVGFGEYELFMLNFVRNDVGEIGEDLSCFFSIIDVPKKQVCN